MRVYVVKRASGDYLRAPSFTTRIPRWHWTSNVDQAWQLLDEPAARAAVRELNLEAAPTVEPIEVK